MYLADNFSKEILGTLIPTCLTRHTVKVATRYVPRWRYHVGCVASDYLKQLHVTLIDQLSVRLIDCIFLTPPPIDKQLDIFTIDLYRYRIKRLFDPLRLSTWLVNVNIGCGQSHQRVVLSFEPADNGNLTVNVPSSNQLKQSTIANKKDRWRAESVSWGNKTCICCHCRGYWRCK